MSTALYPLGMKSYNNHVNQGGYKTWKGRGILANPVGVSASHIRPLTNNDPGNVFPTGFGLPRPIKHYRKGRVIPIMMENPENPNEYIEMSLINYNLNRIVKSSKGSSLGGGSGGLGLLGQMIDNPGGFIVKENTINPGSESIEKECKACEGVGIVSSYYPNTTFLTDNPEPNTENRKLCCNEERKALRRVLPASTNLRKNYYTTHAQYLQNRCQTFEQRAFNFQSYHPVIIDDSNNPYVTTASIKAAKPGSPLALFNTYVANCQPNGEIYEATEIALITRIIDILKSKGIITTIPHFTKISEFFNYINGLPEPSKTYALDVFFYFINNPYFGVPFSGVTNPMGCKLVVYKPNNPQFANQGAVSSSTRILKLNVDTIQTNAASLNASRLTKNKGGVTCQTKCVLRQ